MAKEIKLSNSPLVATVDDDDLEYLMRWTWRLNKKEGYAIRTHQVSGMRSAKQRSMHEEIMGKRDGYQIDHKNHDRLDNRKENLRYATHAQNQQNSFRKLGKSGYRGVHKDCSTYTVRIASNKKRYEYRGFKTVEEAARKFNELALELHGPFAVLNDV